MKLNSISINNFLSIEDATINFDDVGLLLVEGWNFDVDRANGAGKTAVLNAISFALYDKLPRKITASELLRRGTKKGSVRLELTVGSEVLVVDRSRPKGVTYSRVVDGQAEVLNITQEEWEAKLRLSYNQFIVSMYCSQAGSNVSPRFLLLNDADKKLFLLQLLNLDQFSLCKKRADEKAASALLSFNQTKEKINTTRLQVNNYLEQMVDEVWEQDNINQKVLSKNAFLKSILENQKVLEPDFSKYQAMEEGIKSKQIVFAQSRTKRELLFNQWQVLGRKLKPFNTADSCPTCGTELDNSHAESIHNAEMEKIKAERLVLKEQLDSIDASFIDESKVADLAVKLRERKNKEREEYSRAQKVITDNQWQIKLIDNQIGESNKKLLNNTSLKQKVDNLQVREQELETTALAFSDEMEIQKTVSTIYSPTGAQAYVLDSAVALFNEHVAKYVTILWSNLTYELLSSKENVKGEMVAKFSESIVMDGKSISLGSLSGGELKALSICADMALLDILEQQFGIHMSPIIFDEAFDGLDSSGKEFALELIKELAKDRLVMVIDHASEMRASFDKILRVEKRNGISTVNPDIIG